MVNFKISKPQPDFNELAGVLNGTKKNERALYQELFVDEEIKKVVLEDYLGEKYVPAPSGAFALGGKHSEISFAEKKKRYKEYYENTLMFYYRMGYSLYVDFTFMNHIEELNTLPAVKSKDTAVHNKGERYWANTKNGMIASWEDYEKFPWDLTDRLIEEDCELIGLFKNIVPDGMKIATSISFFEFILEWIFGYENLFMFLYDNPDLVSEVFNRVGKMCHKYYKATVSVPEVGAIWHADDLGYGTGTMLSVKDLERLVFPWVKKFAEIAHSHNKPIYCHACGKKDEVMDILIDKVKLDAIHSFEDVSHPVTKYIDIWGDRIGMIGGIDMDKMARFGTDELKSHIKSTLDYGISRGRYVCGTGNTVSNYVPVENYLLLINECQNWTG